MGNELVFHSLSYGGEDCPASAEVETDDNGKITLKITVERMIVPRVRTIQVDLRKRADATNEEKARATPEDDAG